jgi:hypothetical protein
VLTGSLYLIHPSHSVGNLSTALVFAPARLTFSSRSETLTPRESVYPGEVPVAGWRRVDRR